MSNQNNVFTPVVEADAVYGESDWRPLLGEDPRQDGWKVYVIGKQSVDHKLKGVILPSYDFTMSLSDESFGAYVGACWTDQPQKNLERHFAANAFALPLAMYPFLGPRKEHWLSPSNRVNMIGNDTIDKDDAADAFDDLNKWIRRNKSLSQAKKDFFLKADKMTDDPLVPGRSVRYFALNECRDNENQDWHLALTMFTSSAYSYMLEQMRWIHQDKTPPRDPNWPNYMLGDPTDPRAALVWHVDKVQLDPKDPQQTNCIKFTEKREFLDEDQRTREISKVTLAKRFLLPDPANWNIPTYEDQVEFMLANYDPAVTADMIRAACSARCRFDIPTERPESMRLQSAGSDGGESAGRESSSRTRREEREPDIDSRDAVMGGGNLAPRSSAPPVANETPAAESKPAAASQTQEPTSYWAGPAGGKSTRMTQSALQEIIDRGETGYKVNINSEWVKLEESGLVTLPTQEEAPSIPAEEEAPAIPAEDAPPSIPTDATAATGTITVEQMKANLFPDEATLAGMTPANREKAEALVIRAWEATDRGTKRDLPPEIVEELMGLLD